MTVAATIAEAIGQYTASDGAILKFRRYEPAGSPRANVVALHGIQSHSGWYEWSSRRLAQAGCDLRFLDRRGAGLNRKARCDTMSADRLLQDVLEFLDETADEGERRPTILCGVSWAGKLLGALPAFAQQAGHLQSSAIDGIALLYPAIFTHFEPNWLQRQAIRLALALGQGQRTVPIPLDDPQLFTDQPDWQRFIRDDPLVLHRASLSFLAATLELTQQATDLPAGPVPPAFIALAGRDEIVDLEKTRAWAARLPSAATQIVEYPRARHTLEFDACREQFVVDLIGWIESIIASRS